MSDIPELRSAIVVPETMYFGEPYNSVLPDGISIERLTAHGLTAPENLKDYCRCSPVDAQVMDFHIGNLLDAYDFLTAFHHV